MDSVEVQQLKRTFLRGEAWMLTIQGAFQRAKVYSDNVPEKDRELFRKTLRQKLDEILAQYQQPVNDQQHLAHIKCIIEYCNHHHANILKNHELRFGVAQKLLNLYLKYLWCLAEVTEPPHFPVDRQIQEAMKRKVIISWTTDLDEFSYMSVIQEAGIIAGYSNQSLAVWELGEFSSFRNASI
jgi:hypothetical protein